MAEAAHPPTRKALLALVVVVLLLVAGCTGSHHHDAGSDTPGTQDLTDTTTTTRPCSAYKAGQEAVNEAFCTGTAVVHLVVKGKKSTVSGGTCSQANDTFTLDAGVSVGRTFVGPMPAFVGLVTPALQGPFTDATVSVSSRNQTYVIPDASGSLDLESMTGVFSGTDSLSDTSVAATFSC